MYNRPITYTSIYRMIRQADVEFSSLRPPYRIGRRSGLTGRTDSRGITLGKPPATPRRVPQAARGAPYYYPIPELTHPRPML